ncbi:anthranilate phosphoribosyltransferase [Aestuariispira insulae]|uniref:Anthranilate phosphoribosyltransferase n=1 Tax=Aestuariispira insulae TaxID=1461337 RepID=A0A3D9HV11_9PROT|nr:anthranilate phosphoribosyltransferase [Aestuariispira insulae]RED53279.1 anthranilate phosphoribosyltransferase [Aestuariispira insulae]
MTDERNLKPLLAKVGAGQPLSLEEATRAFDIIMSGDATPSQMGAFLMALKVRGETVEEIIGAVKIMREKALIIEAPHGAMDIVGTGGDMAHTYNISTATALVVAGCGVPVAKHGNRAASSKSGTADALSALGLDLETDMENVKRALQEANIGFLMAQRHHGAMRNVGPTRVELGVPTIFNMLGPLSNPALVKHYMIGTYRPDSLEMMAQTLSELGAERAWVVHGADGLDELSTTGVSKVVELKDGALHSFEVSPEEVGLPVVTLEDLRGGTPEENAQAIRDLLNGKEGPYRDVVLFNAAAALIVAGRAADLKEGVSLARDAIDQGNAKSTLDKLVSIAGFKDE